MARPLHGFVENVFLRQIEGERDAFVGREQLPDHRDRMAFYILEEQRRVVRPLVVQLADRAQLVLWIDLRLDLLQLMLLFQDFEKLTQIHHSGKFLITRLFHLYSTPQNLERERPR